MIGHCAPMTFDPTLLDRPAWSALNGPQASLARGDARACRIDPAYGPFAGAVPGEEARLAGLLTGPDDEIWLLEPAPISPPGLTVRRSAQLLQLVAEGPVTGDADGIVLLGESDAPAMTALALATKPGPWGPETWRYGAFYGVRHEGRLIAMAGERLRPSAGVTEVSGVCTDPEFRGRGLAGRLIRHVMAGHRARGSASFLHSYADNVGAIGLYRSLGFAPRADLFVMICGAKD